MTATEPVIEEWRRVWRESFAKILPLKGLEALREALVKDDDRLSQGSTSTSTTTPFMCVESWPVEAACLLGFCGAIENGGFADQTASGNQTNKDAATVGRVEEFFAQMCFDADQMLGEPAACRALLNFYDDTPRERMLAELLPEVERAIAARVP